MVVPALAGRSPTDGRRLPFGSGRQQIMPVAVTRLELTFRAVTATQRQHRGAAMSFDRNRRRRRPRAGVVGAWTHASLVGLYGGVSDSSAIGATREGTQGSAQDRRSPGGSNTSRVQNGRPVGPDGAGWQAYSSKGQREGRSTRDQPSRASDRHRVRITPEAPSRRERRRACRTSCAVPLSLYGQALDGFLVHGCTPRHCCRPPPEVLRVSSPVCRGPPASRRLGRHRRSSRVCSGRLPRPLLVS